MSCLQSVCSKEAAELRHSRGVCVVLNALPRFSFNIFSRSRSQMHCLRSVMPARQARSAGAALQFRHPCRGWWRVLRLCEGGGASQRSIPLNWDPQQERVLRHVWHQPQRHVDLLYFSQVWGCTNMRLDYFLDRLWWLTAW